MLGAPALIWKKRVSEGEKNSKKKAVQNKSGGAGRFKMCKLVKNIK